MAEKSTKNLHMEHLEDDIINLGYKGAQQSLAFVEALADLFDGRATEDVDITVKWDGAPAIVAGVDPETGLFFVATKHAAFAKNMRLAFSEELIDLYYEGKGGLLDTLKIAFRELKDVGIEGVLQGDIMFTSKIKKVQTIDNEQMVTFKPNTIMYTVPVKDPLGKVIQESNLGVVFHTKYTGNGPVNALSASFGVDVSKLVSRTAWIQDAKYRDMSGTLTLTDSERRKIDAAIATIKTNMVIAKPFLNELATASGDLTVGYLFKLYVNKLVREGVPITTASLRKLENFVIERIAAQEKTKKTAVAQERYAGLRRETQAYLKKNATMLNALIKVYLALVVAKQLFVGKLDSSQSIGTFIETPNGFEHTKPEGYVAISKRGQAVKLVNRMEFSAANFNAVKDWKGPAVAPTEPTTALKTLVMTFGRMNPPTAGHKKLLDTVLSTARAENANHVIVLSHSQDKKKNPLDPDTKLEFARKIFPGMNIELSSKLKPSIFKFLEGFSGKYDKMIVVVGSDRVLDFTRDLSAYNGKTYTFKILDVISAGARDPDAEGVTGISASKMREFALRDDYVNFKKGLPSTVSSGDAKALLAAVKEGMK